MDVKVLLLITIFRICGVVSEDCSCFVGYVISDTGVVHLELQTCPPTSTVPPITHTTIEATESSKGAITKEPLAPTSKPVSIATTKIPTATTQKPTTTTMITVAATTNTTPTNTTTKNIAVPSSTPTIIMTTADPQSTTSPKSQQPPDPGSKRRRRDVASQQLEPACHCQISVTNQNNTLKLQGNATGWTANFSCFNSSLENVDLTCNVTKCNNLQLLKTRYKLEVPANCKNTTNLSDNTTKTEGFLFVWSTNQTDRTFESCNDVSKDKCSVLNLNKSTCPQDGVCCCPLPKGICKDPTHPPASSTSLPITRYTKSNQKPGAAAKSQNKSFDWKIVGYIGTGVICGIFLTLLVKFVYGKKKKNQLKIPNYKYSRLRADYVVEDQEL